MTRTPFLQSGDIIVITGGSRGLGADLVKELAESELDVHVVCLDIAKPLGSPSASSSTTPKVSSEAAEVDKTDEPEAVNSTDTPVSDPVSLPAPDSAPVSDPAPESASDPASAPVSATGATDSAETDDIKEGDTKEDVEQSDAEAGSVASPSIEVDHTQSKCMYIDCDVREYDQLEAARKQIVAEFDKAPTVLINNAGIRRPMAAVAEANVEDTGDTLSINLGGAMKATRVFLPQMIIGGRGYVVTVASALAMISPAGMASYGASKSGLLGFHESLTQELKSYSNVHALLVCPGQLDTQMFSDVTTPSELLAPVIQTTDLAQRIIKRINKSKTSTLYYPKYVRYLPYMRALPEPMANWVRRWSGVDKVFESYQASLSSDHTDSIVSDETAVEEDQDHATSDAASQETANTEISATKDSENSAEPTAQDPTQDLVKDLAKDLAPLIEFNDVPLAPTVSVVPAAPALDSGKLDSGVPNSAVPAEAGSDNGSRD